MTPRRGGRARNLPRPAQRSRHGVDGIAVALVGEQPRQARRRAQLQGFRVHRPGERDGFAEVGLCQFALAQGEPQFPATGETMGSTQELLRVGRERLLDGGEGVGERAVEGLRLRQPREVVSESGSCPDLDQAGDTLADQRDAFTSAAQLRPRPA